MSFHFNDQYKNAKVLVIDNESKGFIAATISHIRKVNERINMVIFIDTEGKEFTCGGMVLRDTPENRKLVEFIDNLFEDKKAGFHFLCEIRNFDKTLHDCEKGLI